MCSGASAAAAHPDSQAGPLHSWQTPGRVSGAPATTNTGHLASAPATVSAEAPPPPSPPAAAAAAEAAKAGACSRHRSAGSISQDSFSQQTPCHAVSITTSRHVITFFTEQGPGQQAHMAKSQADNPSYIHALRPHHISESSRSAAEALSFVQHIDSNYCPESRGPHRGRMQGLRRTPVKPFCSPDGC